MRPNVKGKAMPKAVQFGAGNIGRGFLGQMLWEGGYQTTFIDANAVLVDMLNAHGGYPLRLVSQEKQTTIWISDVHAIHSADTDGVSAALMDADFVGTSVGVKFLPQVALMLAQGIVARAESDRPPLDIFLCENQWHASAFVRDLILPHLPFDAIAYFETSIGLVETVIGRMVPAPTAAIRREDPRLVVAEPYQILPVARAMMRGPVPALPGLRATDQFEAYEAQKLFLHNMSHAAMAYLGYQQGYEFVWQCAEDSAIQATCRTTMAEVNDALMRVYRFSSDDLAHFAGDLRHRFANRALGDTVARVAADPIRKLRPEDRLVGAATLCLKAGLIPKTLAEIVAAALRYDHPDDPAAQQLQSERHQQGDDAVLQSYCSIAPGTELAVLIGEALAAHKKYPISETIER